MILGIDSSAISAGCALVDGGKIVSEGFLNTSHTHSETLLPMVKDVLKNAGAEFSDIEKIAVTVGPGSFTGLRIGISAVKGLCFGTGVPCVSVSTLEAIAYNFLGIDGIICACMDARVGQIYNALFRSENGVITRLCEDRALSLSELSAELEILSKEHERIFLAGDGAAIVDGFTDGKYTLSPPALRFQRGSGVCFAAANSPTVEAAALMPKYLRLPQAERERLARQDS
ncbi:MAG: tRNA (adenosine(37)-N6)-threonylcarbamoyltransferase complex dimerization subunit type 1 TsaB [Oscillospiraceae bacterium]|nr:tRNA (adenosine(37)-N6)-threonylcarbamoyltransferase complex dimerization subunit type 1 TsaB [Oscillospiraceae bacterium]